MKMKRTMTTVAIAMLAVPALAACGSSDEDSAAKAAEDFIHAYADGDEKACDLMTSEDGSKPLKDDQSTYDECKGSASQMPQILGESAQKMKDTKITGAEVDGDTATVKKEHIDGPLADEAKDDEGMTLKKIDGDWYVDLSSAAVGG